MIPNNNEPIGGNIPPSLAYRRWFEELNRIVSSISSGSGPDLSGDIAELRAQFEAAQVLGSASVQTIGALSAGTVTVQLMGDQSPAPTDSYYGTDSAGLNGWFSRLLSTLADVDITGLADGDSLLWDSALAKFVPGSGSSSGNLDGGDASTNYGGTSPIDGGGA